MTVTMTGSLRALCGRADRPGHHTAQQVTQAWEEPVQI